jgi:hypothetical protein
MMNTEELVRLLETTDPEKLYTAFEKAGLLDLMGGTTPSEQAVALSGRGQNDSLRQLLALQQMMGKNNAARGFRYSDPLSTAKALQDLMQGGANDPRAYAYGPTKAGPFVFWPSQPPNPRGQQNAATAAMLSSTLGNTLNAFINSKYEDRQQQGGGGLDSLLASLRGGG